MVSEPLTVIFFGAGMNAKPMIVNRTTLAIMINFFELFILFILCFDLVSYSIFLELFGKRLAISD
jgi:hypothetical protein